MVPPLQLPDLLSGDGTKEYQPSPFFRHEENSAFARRLFCCNTAPACRDL